MSERFRKFAKWAADVLGSPGAFAAATAGVVLWALTGPHFRYSDTWQLVINTTTTVITFLMVFLIQHTQNRDTRALHLKLDELIKAKKGARNSMLDLDQLSDEQLRELELEYKRLCAGEGTANSEGANP